MGRQTSAWKAHERAVAKMVNGQRSGNRGAAAPDVTASWCVAECKQRKLLPQWLKDAMLQAENAAAGYTTPKLALVVLHESNGRRADDLVVMRLSEFTAYYGNYRGDALPDEG